MIRILFEAVIPRHPGKSVRCIMSAVPRVGETVCLGPHWFEVTDVCYYPIHQGSDRWHDVIVTCNTESTADEVFAGGVSDTWIDGSPVDETSQAT